MHLWTNELHICPHLMIYIDSSLKIKKLFSPTLNSLTERVLAVFVAPHKSSIT